MTLIDTSQTFTGEELAAIIGISLPLLHKWKNSGRISSGHTFNRHRYWTEDQVREIMRQELGDT